MRNISGKSLRENQNTPFVRFLIQTQWHITVGRTPLDERWPYLSNNTQLRLSQETGIHFPGWIRTRNPSKRAAADPHLRPLAHWDLQCNLLPTITISCSAGLTNVAARSLDGPVLEHEMPLIAVMLSQWTNRKTDRVLPVLCRMGSNADRTWLLCPRFFLNVL